jgi:hypothetical protein
MAVRSWLFELQKMTGKRFTRTVDIFPPAEVLAEIDKKVDFKKMEEDDT